MSELSPELSRVLFHVMGAAKSHYSGKMAWYSARDVQMIESLPDLIAQEVNKAIELFAKEHAHEQLVEYAKTGTCSCLERSEQTYNDWAGTKAI